MASELAAAPPEQVRDASAGLPAPVTALLEMLPPAPTTWPRLEAWLRAFNEVMRMCYGD